MSAELASPAATIVPFAPTSAEGWAARILTCWRESLTAILEAGHLLAAAKAALPHGAFGAMIAERLPFSASTAERLMKIAADPKLSNPAHVQHLPPHWGTLYELTKLDEEQFSTAIAQGVIRPDMERKEAPRPHVAGRIANADDLDYAPTPPWATRALLEEVLPILGTPHICSAWEPACGEGHIAEVLHEYIALVRASDIHDYGYGDATMDFLDPATHMSPNPDFVITNPPFEDRVLRFMLRALDVASVGVAMFLHLRYLEGIERYNELFSVRPPTLVAPFVERVPLLMGHYDPKASTTTAFMWLVWVHGMAPQPPFWIPPGCRERLTYDDDAERFTQHPVARKSYSPADLKARYNGAKISAVIPVPDPLGFWREQVNHSGASAGATLVNDGENKDAGERRGL